MAEPLVFEEGIDFDWPVENVEPLAVRAASRLVENLTSRLGCRALASGDLGLDDEARRRAAATCAPCRWRRRRATWPRCLSLVRLALETAPPANAVEGIVVRTAPARTRPAQLSFFEPAGPSPDKLASTLARLQALVGDDARGRAGGARSPPARRLHDAAVRCAANSRVSRQPVGRRLSDDEARALSLHALRPPMDAEARLDRGELRYLAGQGIGGQVLAAAGPFRVRDGWWQLPVTRDYYDVQLSDGAIYRVFHDLTRDSWHIDGCYE